MENKLPGDDALNDKLPDFMKGMGRLKKDLSGLPDLLGQFQKIMNDKLGKKSVKEGIYQGRKVRMTLFEETNEIMIRFADLGIAKKEFNSIK